MPAGGTQAGGHLLGRQVDAVSSGQAHDLVDESLAVGRRQQQRPQIRVVDDEAPYLVERIVRHGEGG